MTASARTYTTPRDTIHASMKDKLTDLEERRAALGVQLNEQEERPVMIHPGLAEVYRWKVAELTTALNVVGTKLEAAELLRGLLSGIRLIPEGRGIAIELTGKLANIMALSESRNDKTRAQGAGSGLLTMVAGAGFEPAAFRL